MASNLRRLASDHASLHNSGLPPHYLFPPSTSLSAIPDDLTQLTILLTGPQGTPYSQGLWRLHLKIPNDYPKNPPKASFRTRIWHPNVDETSGAVCVDTLKRDWEPKLTLRDVLITISCLLIHPNPDSALNSAAGALLQDDYDEFARQARLMTSIHAPIPADLKVEVMSAKRRGDDGNVYIHDEDETDQRPLKARKAASAASVVVMKKSPAQTDPTPSTESSENMMIYEEDMSEDDEENDPASESKENDPSLSPSLVTCTPPSPRRSVLGKRPLSVLATSTDPDTIMVDINDDHDNDDPCSSTSDMTSSEKNIAANNNNPSTESSYPGFSFQRKLPGSENPLTNGSKHLTGGSSNDRDSILSSSSGGSSSYSIHDDTKPPPNIFSGIKPSPSFEVSRDNDSKENFKSSSSHSSSSSTSSISRSGKPGILKQKQTPVSSRQTLTSKITKPSSSTSGAAGRKLSATKPKPRVGVRRL